MNLPHNIEVRPLIAVWFSCGAASAVAAKLTLSEYPKADVRILNNPVPEEHEDNRRFLRDVEEWLGQKIEIVKSEKYNSCVDVWEKVSYMSGVHGAPCTLEMKKKPRQNWEKVNKPDFTVLGFTADEKARSERFQKFERESLLPILIDKGVTKADCFDILTKAGLKLPQMYHDGFPNSNCIGCVKATSPTYWNLVRQKYPEVFKIRAIQSKEMGAKLVRVKGKREFLEDLDPKAKGNAIKGMLVECGAFCEEMKT